MRYDATDLRNTQRYIKLRAAFIRMNPLCAECQRQRLTNLSEELDHIVPFTDAPQRFWDQTNWQALCRACHEQKTGLENRSRFRSVASLRWGHFQEMEKYDG